MPSLRDFLGRMKTLRNMSHVELIGIPVLQACVLPTAFKCVVDVKMENASLLEEIEELSEVRKREEEERRKREEEERRRKREEEERRKKEEEERRRKEEEERRRRQEEERRRRRAAEEERLRKEREEAAAMAKKKVVISCKRDCDRVDYRVVESIEVSDGCCNEKGPKELGVRGFVNLKELKVGNECFEYVDEVKLIGLVKLESVCIGRKSLTKIKSVDDEDKEKDLWDQIDHNRRFYLKNCPKLRELRIGPWSCLDYSVIEIENVDALEVIEMGGLDEVSCNFAYASLELKSILIHSE